MGNEIRKEQKISLRKGKILEAAERLFSTKGYKESTIDDISKEAGFSRRTIYAYYSSKEDIIQHIIEKSLIRLKDDVICCISEEIHTTKDFFDTYNKFCETIVSYENEYIFSSNLIISTSANDFNLHNLSETSKHIIQLGSEINSILDKFLKDGQKKGIVRKNIITMLTIYVLWSNISSLLILAHSKEMFICNQFSMSKTEFLKYSFKQIINSILIEKI